MLQGRGRVQLLRGERSRRTDLNHGQPQDKRSVFTPISEEHFNSDEFGYLV